MKLNFAKKYHQMLKKTDGIFLNNPILSLGLALPLAIIPSYGVAGTTAISLAMLFCFVPIVLVASIVGDNLPRHFRVIVYPLLSGLLLIPTSYVVEKISPAIFDTLGVYFSLICVNSMLNYSVEKAHIQKPLPALAFALRQWLGASLVAFIFSFVRQLLASGSAWGVKLFSSIPSLSVAQMAFGGFILLGFFAALCRLIHRAILSLTLRAGENDEENGGAKS